MTLNCVMTVILRYFTKFGRSGPGPVTSKWLKLDSYCLNDVARRIFFSAIYDLLSEITEKQCVKERHPALESENSTCATLRGHLSNSCALAFIPCLYLALNN